MVPSITDLIAARLLCGGAEPALADAAFEPEWSAAGGRRCAGALGAALRALAGRDCAALALPAQALQDACWEQLHSGHWSGVHVVSGQLKRQPGRSQAQAQAWRDAYSLATLLVAAAAAAAAAAGAPPPSGAAAGGAPGGAAAARPSPEAAAWTGGLEWALKQLDLAAMMGGPRFRAVVDEAIAAVEAALAESDAHAPPAAGGESGAEERARGAEGGSGPKRRRLSGGEARAGSPGPAPLLLSQLPQPRVPLPPGAMEDARLVVPVVDPPSLEAFMTDYMMAPGGGRPVVIRGAMGAWPAMERWQDISYLERVAGRRTVPVEVGQHYLEESWGTRLMTLGEFLRDHVAGGGGGASDGEGSSSGGESGGEDSGGGGAEEGGAGLAADAGAPEPAAAAEALPAAAAAGAEAPEQAGAGRRRRRQPRAYLAQHELFEQLPALAADIAEPDYCCLGEGGVRSVNAWLGPAGTVTPFHQDPYHNLLAQVVGRKYVRLAAPAHTAALYPHAAGMHTNSSQVDADAPDHARFPLYAAAPYLECVLEPGQMLYIPPRHWHYVKAVTASFSCSFWWS